jgi:hypothetical protein
MTCSEETKYAALRSAIQEGLDGGPPAEVDFFDFVLRRRNN